MSHYTVAVFTDKGQYVEDLLEPYDENLRVELYIGRTRKQMIDEARQYKELLLKRIRENENYELSSWEKEILECKTDEELYFTEVCSDNVYDMDGNELTTYNPKSKWDWYSVGGRWSNMLKTKYGMRVDTCLVSELDLKPNKKEYDEAARFWELVVEEQPLRNGEEKPFNFHKKEYYLNRYGTKENYAMKCSTLSTYAVLTPDGEWHEPGQMGWWGISSAKLDDEKAWDEAYHKFLDEADPNWRITIVDCHI